MANKIDNTKSSNTKKPSAFINLASKIISSIDDSYSTQSILDSSSRKFNSILDKELKVSKGVSGGNIVDFIQSMASASNQPNTKPNGSDASYNNELFTKDINDIFGYFQDMSRNRYIEMSDLKFISKFIPALGEAVRTTVDTIVSSDDIADTINRIIDFDEGVSTEDREVIIAEVERQEKEHKLLKKLRNIAYKKAAVAGETYVYAIPYTDLFHEYENIKNGGDSQSPTGTGKRAKTANESTFSSEDFRGSEIDFALESTMHDVLKGSNRIKPKDGTILNRISEADINSCVESTLEHMPKIRYSNSHVLSSALEAANTIANDTTGTFDSMWNKSEKNINKSMTADGTYNMSGGKNASINTKSSNFDINGSYVKFIDAKNMIPCEVMDRIVGYFLFHPTVKKNKSASATNGINSIGTTLFSSVDITEKKKQDAIARIVNTITNGIMTNFSESFIKENEEFKDLIAECVVANGLTDKEYSIQFIPAKYIHCFKLNEDENGHGTSILSDSLFPAKILLSMVVCRVLNYVNKTGSKTYYYVHKNPMDTINTNQAFRVVRDLQDSNITFNDLLSPNLVFNKFNRDGSIQMPMNKNGEHMVEIETQDGQNIDMSPEYEKQLEAWAILGTGVPSVIMDYIGQIDFAKQIVSANIRFAGRISTYQSDLEDTTTELYKSLLESSQLSDEHKTIVREKFKFKLPRPKVLVNGNTSDYLRTMKETATDIAEIMVGASGTTITNPDIVKEEIIRNVVMDNSQYFDWNSVQAIVNKAIIKSAQSPVIDKVAGGGEADAGGGMDDTGDDF